jgi:phage terminase small subunit
MFVLEYLKDLNATQAAIRAGYSKKTAASVGHENLRKPEIAAEISKSMDHRNKVVSVDAAYVLQRLKDIDEMDVIDILNEDLTIKPLSQWPKIWRTMISGIDINTTRQRTDDETVEESILKKMKWPDKVKNLDLIGKHVDVQAFNDRLEISGKIQLEDIVADIDV